MYYLGPLYTKTAELVAKPFGGMTRGPNKATIKWGHSFVIAGRDIPYSGPQR